jgi:phosphomannomutase
MESTIGSAPSADHAPVRRIRHHHPDMSSTVNPSIFKAYDIRGVYGEDIDAGTAHAIGRAFTRVIAGMAGKAAAELTLGLGRDMRLQAPELAQAYRDGMVAEGATVLDAGQVGTEMLYFLVGSRELDGGLMCTASHNPKRYTGVKLVREGALALSGEEGIGDIRDMIAAGLGDRAPQPGSVQELDVYEQFHAAALSVIDPRAITPLKVVVDGGNGMAGPMVGPLLERLGLDLETAYWTPDGSFPDHEPNPLLPENREFIMREVTARGADLGIAWDGDADRCFFIDDTGAFVDGDFLTALMSESMLDKHPGATVLYDVRASRAVADTAAAHGGTALVNRVGHAFFKSRMRQVPEAVFGGEVSGHYYFRDFYCADSGTLPALLILELLSARGVAMSELLEPFRSRYFISGEINSEVADAPARMEEIAERYGDAEVSRLDGISIDYEDWHFNVRASNTEPLLRLCLESLRSREHMEAKRDEVLSIIRG